MVRCLGSIPTCSRQYCHRLNKPTMKVKHLIKLLKKCDPNSDIRAVKEPSDDPYVDYIISSEVNDWVHGIEESHKGESGYELEGEVRLITNE